MTVQEYVESVPADRWNEVLLDIAKKNLTRLLMAPGAYEVISDEFHDDVYDYFEQCAKDQGMGDDFG